MSEHVGTLHLHAQSFPHDEAWVVGDRDGLQALRDAIDAALSGHPSAARSFAADGEGFVSIVVCAEMGSNPLLPYAEANNQYGRAQHPYELLPPGVYRQLVRGE